MFYQEDIEIPVGRTHTVASLGGWPSNRAARFSLGLPAYTNPYHILYHFIRECVENGHINVEHVSGELQRADILTKALPRLKFTTMRQMLRVQDLGQSNNQD